MANEIHVDYDSGSTLYALIRNSLAEEFVIDTNGRVNTGNNSIYR